MDESLTDKIKARKIKITKLGVAHFTVGFIASTSVKLVVGTAIAQIVPTETKAQKAKLAVGTYVLSGIVQDHARAWARDEFDSKLNLVKRLKTTIEAELEKEMAKTQTEETPK